MTLACGRSAKVTVSALCVLTTNAGTGPRGSELFARRNGSVSPSSSTLQIIEIPTAARGVITLRFETDDPMIRTSVVQGAEFITRVVGKRWLPRSTIRIRALAPFESRAHAQGTGQLASIHLRPGVLDVKTAVHELGHHIETDHADVLEAAKFFLNRRARGGPVLSLRELTGQDYGADEVAFPANWSKRGGTPYSGKFYGASLQKATATELISTGIERLHGNSSDFFRADADYFLFLLLVLQSQ